MGRARLQGEVPRYCSVEWNGRTENHRKLTPSNHPSIHNPPPTMRWLGMLGLVGLASCHNILLLPHARECYHEIIHKDDKMAVSYQVGDRGGYTGELDIEFWIVDPAGRMIVSERKSGNGDHSFTAELDGKYIYCFSNQASSAATKEISFNVHGIVYVPEEEHHGDPLEKEVRMMAEMLAQVKDEQEYIVIRERTHRNTAESTNSRVKWWSLFQFGVLIANCMFQIFYLKRFFEVKRLV